VSTANYRTASLALDTARPIVARLDAARNPEDVAADIIDAWNGAETALRALAGGSPAGGQALIRDLRTNQALSLEQGHALLGFLGARDRVARTEYRPTVMEGGLAVDGAAMGMGAGRPTPVVAAPVTMPSLETPYRTGETRVRRVPILPIALGLLLLAALGVGAWWWSQRDEREMDAGIAAYKAGDANAARTHFTAVARNDPDRAEPHIFLARMARDEGNLPGALSELQTAIRLDQRNPLALREMGAYLYTVQRYDLARNFYIRALQVNPADRESQGYLGCSLLRLGRVAEAQRFLQRAGQGTWSACAQQVMPPQPGMLPQQPGAAYPTP
jgi:hypothetical protein